MRDGSITISKFPESHPGHYALAGRWRIADAPMLSHRILAEISNLPLLTAATAKNQPEHLR